MFTIMVILPILCDINVLEVMQSSCEIGQRRFSYDMIV